MDDFHENSRYTTDNVYLDNNSESEVYEAVEFEPRRDISMNMSGTFWSDKALEVLDSIVQEVSASRKKFSTQRNKLQYICDRMKERGYHYSVTHIQAQLKNPRKVAKPKTGLNSEYMDLANASIKVELIDLDLEEPPVKKSKCGADEQAAEVIAMPVAPTWGEDATKLLLSLLRETKPQMGNSPNLQTKKSMWKFISSQMFARGYNFEPNAIETKWQTLVRTYRRRLEKRQTKEEPTRKVGEGSSSTAMASSTSSQNDEAIADLNPSDTESSKYVNTADYQFEEDHSQNYEVCEDVETLDEPPPEDKSIPETFSDSDIGTIAREISLFRKQNFKFEDERLKMQKEQMDLYKERTKEISKLGNALVDYLKAMHK